jgi:hypothetical protein
MKAVEKRTVEDYQEFIGVLRELGKLEQALCLIGLDTTIHNHIVDTVRDVDEETLFKLKYYKEGDDVEDFVTWMHIWKSDERILRNLDPDTIYHDLLNNYRIVEENLSTVMDKVAKLNMDKSRFQLQTLSVKLIPLPGGGVTEKRSDKSVHYLYETVKILPAIKRLVDSLKEEYENLKTKFDKAETLYRWFHVNTEEVDRNNSILRTVITCVGSEKDDLEYEVDQIRIDKKWFSRIWSESDVCPNWHRTNIDFIERTDEGKIYGTMNFGGVERGQHYSIDARIKAREFIREVLEKRGKIVIMGNTLYRDENDRLISDTEVSLSQRLLDLITEPIHTPTRVIEPSEWVKKENEQLRTIWTDIVDCLKSQNKKMKYEDIYKAVWKIDEIDPYKLKYVFLDQLVADGRITQDEEFYWYAGNLGRFEDYIKGEVERFRKKGINAVIEDEKKRVSIRFSLPSPELDHTLKESIITEMYRRGFKPQTILIYPKQADSICLYKNNMEIYSEREDSEMPGLELCVDIGPRVCPEVASKIRKEMEDEKKKTNPNINYVNLTFHYQALKAQEEIREVLAILDKTLSAN